MCVSLQPWMLLPRPPLLHPMDSRGHLGVLDLVLAVERVRQTHWRCALHVGRKDRFAQFQKYFASVGLDAPWVADAGLVVAAALEVFAGVLRRCLASFPTITTCKDPQLVLRRRVADPWNVHFFSVGDHWFGDRFELLEHTLFWFIAAVSWVVFVKA